MDIQTLQVVLQSVSALAIAGSLVYATVQFRHARDAQRVANFSKLVELQMDLRRMRVEDPRLAYVYKDDVKNLKDDAEVREYFFNLMQLSVFEIVWFMHRNRQLPEDYFASWAKRMQVIESEESFRRMMDNPSMKILHDEFQTYVQDMLKDARKS